MTTQTQSSRAEYVKAYRDEQAALAAIQLLEQELEYRRGAHRKARANLLSFRQKTGRHNEAAVARLSRSPLPTEPTRILQKIERDDALRARSALTSPKRRGRRLQLNRRIRHIREERTAGVPAIWDPKDNRVERPVRGGDDQYDRD